MLQDTSFTVSFSNLARNIAGFLGTIGIFRWYSAYGFGRWRER